MATATINVRMPEDLKTRGMQVLEREGVSVTDLVRSLFSHLEQSQELPEFAKGSQRGMSSTDAEQRRAAMRSLIGILPPEAQLEAARHERLMRKTSSGVRA
ncbi:MAG: hypothetical protein FWE65_01095 [Eggerthellaceae bacterium]|nr:hypothetical protein [Eggerthellaceae bacterium]